MKTAVKTFTPDQVIGSFPEDEIEIHARLRSDPIFFAQNVCGLEPHSKQREFLRSSIEQNMRVMLPWGRQFGKSKITSLYIAHRLFAEKDFSAFLFAPSGDQDQIFSSVVKVYETSPYLNRYAKWRVKGHALYVGDANWGSKVELVRCGLTGDLGRGRSTSSKGICVFDEFSQFIYPDAILGALSPITASGGGIILLSSPGDIDSTMHRMYENWKELSKTNSKYRVIDCEWQDTHHITEEWVDDQKRHHDAMGTSWIYEREILGKWVNPANTWFSHDDIQRCIEPTIQTRKGDMYVWSCDPGGHGKDSAFVLCIARYNQALSRLEVVDLRSFKFQNFKYRNDANNDGSETIQDYETIVELCCDLRLKYPPVWFGYDKGTERSLGEQLENLQFPISEIMTGGYAAKKSMLQDLKRGLSEQRIVWNDSRITRQLQSYCPRRDEHTQRWKFPSANADVIMCLGQQYRYLGERTESPFIIEKGNRAIW